MITSLKTDSSNSDFEILVANLDAELAVRDGDDHAFYHQFNSIEALDHVVLVYHKGIPVGCGALKTFDEESMEIKRMFTTPEFRGKGVASLVLKELIAWATTLKMRKCILETGMKQPEAIALYQKHGFNSISNYGPYVGVENSVCFEKILDLTDYY